MEGSSDWNGMAGMSWYPNLNTLDAKTAWNLARDKIQEDFFQKLSGRLSPEFIALPDLETRNLFGLSCCFVRQFSGKKFGASGLKIRPLPDYLLPVGPLSHMVSGSSSNFQCKMDTSWTHTISPYHRIVLYFQEENGMSKEVEIRLMKIDRISQPAFTPGDCGVSLSRISQMRSKQLVLQEKAPKYIPASTSIYIAHDIVKCKEVNIMLRIDDDKEIFKWKDVQIGFLLTRYSNLRREGGDLHYPIDLIDNTNWNGIFGSPQEVCWPKELTISEFATFSSPATANKRRQRAQSLPDSPEYLPVLEDSPSETRGRSLSQSHIYATIFSPYERL